MMNLKLIDAFAIYGATPSHRLHSVSAIASDGAMVLTCSAARFRHPSPGVLRYADSVSRDPQRKSETAALIEHLTKAHGEDLAVRMIVIVEKATQEGGTKREVHVRTDLIGKIMTFDGNDFTVDFVRAGSPQEAARNLKPKSLAP